MKRKGGPEAGKNKASLHYQNCARGVKPGAFYMLPICFTSKEGVVLVAEKKTGEDETQSHE